MRSPSSLIPQHHTDNHTHVFFDLLGLPWVIRRIIYTFVLEGADTVYKCKSTPTPYLGLLRVNKQVSTETLQLMYQSKIYKLDFTRKCAMLAHHCKALQTFRQIHITMPVRQEIFERRTSKDRTCHVLNAIAKNLLKGHAEREKDVCIEVKIRFDVSLHLMAHRKDRSLDTFHPLQTFENYWVPHQNRTPREWKLVSLYYKTQLKYLVDQMREKIQELPNVKIKTNVDCTWPGFEVRRMGHNGVAFKSLGEKLLGEVTAVLRGDERKIGVEFANWDD